MKRGFFRALQAVLLTSLFLPARSSFAVMPARPDLGDEARRAAAALAPKQALAARSTAAAFRPLDPGETRALRVLVILVDFSDQPATRPAAEISRLFFSEQTIATGSLRDFYLENSRSRLSVTGTVVGWLRAPQTYAYYVDGKSGFGSAPRNAQTLAETAIDMARSRVRFSDFDNDGPDGVPRSGDDDGLVDAIIVVHSGIGAEDAESPPVHIWSHSSKTTGEIADDGARAFFYSMTPELSEVGVQCHEFGHLLGLPDLYDTTPPGSPNSYGLGYWSLMAIGAWGGPASAPGAVPVHLDAWCKARLGFLYPESHASNVLGVVIEPVEEAGAIHRLSKNGEAHTTYFLAENRRRLVETFDRYAPGDGLVVYRIDETAGDNDDEENYRVGVVQADGRRDLEAKQNAGDASDPFPGSAGVTSYVAPDTIQIALLAIRELPDDAVRADLIIERRPAFRVVSVRAEAPDVWPWPRWGESAPLMVTVANVGLPAGAATADLIVADPRVQISGGPVAVGPIPENVSAAATFTMTTDPVDPLTTLGIPARLAVAHDGTADTVAVLLTVGRGFGLETSFEAVADTAGWAHAPTVPGRRDSWDLTGVRVASGTRAFRFTSAPHGTYLIDSDGMLVSPPVLLGMESRLTFRHWIAAEEESRVFAYDGGRVEMSVEDGPWTPIEPESGYPYEIDPFTATMLGGERVYSGSSGGWATASFDLREVTGSARFRFRFVADQSVNREGWYIDDVSVTTLAQPFRVALAAPSESGDGVRVAWSVEDVFGPYDGAGFRLYRTDDWTPGDDPSDGYALVAEIAADSSGVFAFEDAPLARGRLYSYLLEDRDAAGAKRAVYGPVSVFLTPGSGGAQILAPFPNPLREGATLTIMFVIPGEGTAARGTARLALYDVRGRRIRVLDERPAVPGLVTVAWDGRDGAGRRVASGVYVLRAETPAGSATRRLVVVR